MPASEARLGHIWYPVAQRPICLQLAQSTFQTSWSKIVRPQTGVVAVEVYYMVTIRILTVRIACLVTHKDHKLICASIVYSDPFTCIIKVNH